MSGGGRATWDIVCRVVDNFGDVGIAWRLARQLAGRGKGVRLVVDGLPSLARIEPRVDPDATSQHVDGVALVPWSVIAGVGVETADVVVELLGCGLPDACLDALQARARPAIWIDFEHLSAEAWVDRFHGLPSPHPTRPLVKHFFYPGFGERSGGLLIDAADRPKNRAPRLLGGGIAGSRLASVFCYPDAPVDALLDVMESGRFGAWTVLVFGESSIASLRDRRSSASNRLRIVPAGFVDQAEYDDVLAACDLNFVRGEDSFVRAQWAARPLVWQAYRQTDDAHRAKLLAFEAIHGVGLAANCRAVQWRCVEAWNGFATEPGTAIADYLSMLPELQQHATDWRARLAARRPLVDRLIAFAEAR